jgi:hypothetical protein
VYAIARGALPASCGRDNCAVHVERASLLAEEAALKQAVRILVVQEFLLHAGNFQICLLPPWDQSWGPNP